VPKEVTTLIAICVKFASKVNDKAIKRVASEPERFAQCVDQMLIEHFARSNEYNKSGWSIIADASQGEVERRRQVWKNILSQIGIGEGKDPVSAPLPNNYLDELTSLSAPDLATRFAVGRP
jgi:hypothetical protein